MLVRKFSKKIEDVAAMLIKEHYSSQAKIWNLSLFCWPPMLLETEPQLLLTPKGLMRVDGMDRINTISKPSHYQILSFKLLKHGRFLINYRFLLLWVELKKGYAKYQIWSNSHIFICTGKLLQFFKKKILGLNKATWF